METVVSRRGRTQRVVGAALFGVGGVLLVASVVYYSYGAVATSKLDELSYSAERPSMTTFHQSEAPAPEGGAAALDGRVLSQEGDVLGAAKVNGLEGQGAPSRDDVVGEQQAAMPGADPGYLPDGEATVTGRWAVRSTGFGGVDLPYPGKSMANDEEGDDVIWGGGETPEVLSADSPSAEVSYGDAWAPTRELFGADAGGDIDGPDVEVAAVTLDDAESSWSSGDGESVPVTWADFAASQADWGALRARRELLAAAFSSPRGEVLQTETASYSDPGAAELGGNPGSATRISIPVIDVDSSVEELEVVFRSNGFSWENPYRVVGHIPTTARPSGQGIGWYFGHLESPIIGQGNEFRRLPEIPALLRSGEAVQVFLEVDNRTYVYQVYHTEAVEVEDLQITDSGDQDITLVTCYPRLRYDKRLLVTAALIDVRES